MDVVDQRILIFGDSLSHHGPDSEVEIWDVNMGSGRSSSAPGDLLASLLLEQGAQAVRIDANVGRSAHNFWAGNAKRQLHSAQDLIASDQAWQPTKVIVMLGTNDADSGAIDANAMAAIRDAYASMGAEIWAIGPPVFTNGTLNDRADQVYTMMSDVFGGRLIDARALSSTEGRAADGVHFTPAAAQAFALQLANALISTKSKKPWLGIALGVGIVGLLGFALWRNYRPSPLAGPSMLTMIASESQTPEEFARRAEAWASTQARPPGDRSLVRAYPNVSLRMLHEARRAREGSSRQRFQALIAEPEDADLDGPAMHMVDGKRWVRGHSPAAAGYREIACKAGIPNLHCWSR